MAEPSVDELTGRKPWIVGVSGASGTPYAAAVLRALLDAGRSVDLVVSRAARLTILDETGLPFRDGHWREDLSKWAGIDAEVADVMHWPAGDFAAGPSSGSYPAHGMIVVPASTAACAGIAIGLSKDLLQRAAEVSLKERRPLLILVREMPFGHIQLKNMLAVSEAGGIVACASPGFYHRPQTISDQVDFVVGRVLDQFGFDHSLFKRWKEEARPLPCPGKQAYGSA